MATASDSLDAWRTVAAGWERRRELVWDVSHEVGERLVDALDPQPGDTVLELAAGPGDTGFTAARRLSAGRLISTDFAPEMVEAARRRADQLGLRNVEHRVVDAQAIPLADGSVDGVLCRWGYMLMPDPAAALRETLRVLRAGGRLAFSVWASALENPWGSTVGLALVELGLAARPLPDAPGPFRLADVGALRELVAAAGFADVAVEDVPVVWRYASFAAYWDVSRDLSASLSGALRTLEAPDADRVRRVIASRLERFADESGALAIPGLCRNVVATKAPA